MSINHRKCYDAIVVGGGQAGLAAGYYLQRAGHSFVIVDANERPGDMWRTRWDSLRLFSPAQYDGLPGLPFPARYGTFPTKDEMADYLENYVRHFDLPILNGTNVTRIGRSGSAFVVESIGQQLTAGNVIIASGAYAHPRVPDFAGSLNSAIEQIHSSRYRRPLDIEGTSILVVGFGTSGAEIATELANAGRSVMLSGRPTPQVLSKIVPAIFAGRTPLLKLLGKAYWSFIHRIVTIDTALGRKAKAQIALRGQPLVRINQGHVRASGVKHVPRVTGVAAGLPQLEDGRVLDVSAVVWCTGFRPNYSFVDLPVLPSDAKGWPVAPYGCMPEIPGLYFLGVPFQVGLTSTLVGGVGRDAALVVQQIGKSQASFRKREEIPIAGDLVASLPDESTR